jgi:GT2 family glycosyltransferase
MITTDIVIVSYKDEEPLAKCIASIKEHCTDYNLIVEDNNVDNRGYTKGVNDGIKKGSAPFIWLLNSDAIVLEGAQQGLIDMFSYHEKVGIVGSQQLDYLDRDFIAHGGTTKVFPGGIHKSGRVSMGHYRIPEKQTWVNGASMMLNRKMVDSIGLLDEKFFLIYSDSDYCFTARLNGWEVWYTPASKVLHRLNVSKKPGEWHQKDMKAFMSKWGIVYLGTGADDQPRFQYSPEFAKLDKFP